MKKLFVIFCAILMTTILLIPLITSAADNAAGEEYILYVSPDGNDSGDGSITNPLATPAGAKNFVRESGMLGKKSVRVKFLPGNYYVNRGIAFTKEDAGTEKCPVVWEAEEKNTVSFRGTTVLDNSLFVPVTDEDVLERIPSEARANIMQFDLAENGISIPTVKAYMWNRMNSKQQPFTSLLRNGKEQTLSRWPNGESNYAFFDTVLSPGVIDSPFEDMENGVQIEFNDPRISRWTTAKDAYITGHTSVTFSIDYLDVQKVDAERGVIYTMAADEYKPKDASPKGFQIVNLIEELDSASEWFIDFDKQILYYFPPSELDENTKLELITLNDTAMIEVEKDAEIHTTFRNIDFIGSRRRLVYSLGKNVNFDRCSFMYSKEREAIYIYCNQFIIENCVIAHHDGRGISFGSEGEIKKAVRDYSIIRNNYFHDLGNLSTSLGHAIISTSGSGVDIYQNTMHYLPQGTFLGGWDVCDVRLFYNEFYNYGRNLSDMGGFYIGFCGSAIGTEVAYNYFYDYQPANPNIGKAVQGVYFDDGACYGYVHHNTFINGAGYGVQIGGGKYNRAESNIMIQMGSGPFVTDARVEEWANGPQIANQTHSQSAARIKEIPRYSRIYPWTNHIYESPMQAPYGNVIRNNISDKKFNINKRMTEFGKVENNYQLSDYSHFVDPENYDYRIKDNSIFAKTIPELTQSNYNLESVGCSLDVTEYVDRNFSLLSPAKDADFDFRVDNLSWEKATMADKYVVTIATDENMQNIVFKEEVYYNFCIPTDLSENVKYYWQVEAFNTSMKRKSSWKSNISSFVNKAKTSDKLEDITYYLSTTEYLLKKEDPARYASEAVEKLEAAIAETRRFYNEAKRNGGATEEEIDAQIDKLILARNNFSKSEIINYTAFNSDYFKDSDNWYLNGIGATVNNDEINFRKINSDLIPLATLKEQPNRNDVLTFRAKIDNLNDNLEGSWVSFDLRKKSTDRAAYNDAGIMVIIKRHKIEIQSYQGAGGGGIVATIENKWTKDGQWHEYAVGAINKADALRIVLVIDGEVVVNHLDYSTKCDFDGYFGAYVANAALTMAPSQMDYNNIETGVNNYYAGKSGYNEEGTWQVSEIKGEDGNDIRSSSMQGAKATWSIDGLSGHKRIYFRRNALADGDSNAKLTISTDHVDKMTGEEATKEVAIDFSSGESEWVLIDENRYDNGRITLTLTGSGTGKLYADTIRVEEMED